MKIDAWVSIGALVTAVIAAILAFRSNSIARRALAISERQQAAHDAEIHVYLMDGFRRVDDHTEGFAFAVAYTNRSDLPNSLARIDLEVHYVTDAGTPTHLVLPLSSRMQESLLVERFPILQAPLGLDPRATVSGWLFFSAPIGTVKGRIDRYRIVATSATNDAVEVTSFLLRSVFDEEESPA